MPYDDGRNNSLEETKNEKWEKERETDKIKCELTDLNGIVYNKINPKKSQMHLAFQKHLQETHWEYAKARHELSLSRSDF